MRWLLAVCVVAVGCDDRMAVQPPIETSRVLDKLWPVPRIERTDVLFVIDRSPAMNSLRATLTQELEVAGDELLALPGYTELHIGVIDAAGGPLLTSSLVDGPFITVRRSWAGTRTNISGTIGAALSAVADLSATSDGPVQPLEAMRIALAANEGGFVRSNARLVVVLISAQIDTSPRSLSAYAAVLKGMPSDQFGAQVFVASDDPKLRAFAKLFPNRGTSISLADPELAYFTGYLYLSTYEWATGVASPCFDAQLLDMDPGSAGLQPDCVVTEGSALVPACTNGGSLPCFRIYDDDRNCAVYPTAITIERPDIDPEPGALDLAQCIPL